MSALDHYRAPASGLVLVAPLVPLDPWRCRWFGHRLWCRVIPAKVERKHVGWFIFGHWTDVSDYRYPNRLYAPSDLELVWCERCGREWKREEQDK